MNYEGLHKSKGTKAGALISHACWLCLRGGSHGIPPPSKTKNVIPEKQGNRLQNPVPPRAVGLISQLVRKVERQADSRVQGQPGT